MQTRVERHELQAYIRLAGDDKSASQKSQVLSYQPMHSYLLTLCYWPSSDNLGSDTVDKANHALWWPAISSDYAQGASLQPCRLAADHCDLVVDWGSRIMLLPPSSFLVLPATVTCICLRQTPSLPAMPHVLLSQSVQQNLEASTVLSHCHLTCSHQQKATLGLSNQSLFG